MFLFMNDRVSFRRAKYVIYFLFQVSARLKKIGGKIMTMVTMTFIFKVIQSKFVYTTSKHNG